jgi:alpha-tubulin suppressor-like RCC1 family protein
LRYNDRMLRLRQFTFAIVLVLLTVLTVSQADSGEKLVSISTGARHTCGLTASGTAYCWGLNETGELGNDSRFDSSVPIKIATKFDRQAIFFSNISAGGHYTCGITLVGHSYCWGMNNAGELGIEKGHTPGVPFPVNAPKGEKVLIFSLISTSFSHTCGLTLSGKAYCWGENYYGELGNNDFDFYHKQVGLPIPVSPPELGSALTFSSISSGSGFTCGLTQTGKAYCWGTSKEGALGNTITSSSSSPISVISAVGKNPLTFSNITTGDSHTCALTSNGKAYCWGLNKDGELGNSTTKNSNIPIEVTTPKDETPVILASISTFYQHTCGLTTSGKAYCWGANEYGQLGNDSTTNSLVPIAVVSSVNGETLTFSSIDAGLYHTCGITTMKKAYCWGLNDSGELGNNTTTNSSIPVPVNLIP